MREASRAVTEHIRDDDTPVARARPLGRAGATHEPYVLRLAPKLVLLPLLQRAPGHGVVGNDQGMVVPLNVLEANEGVCKEGSGMGVKRFGACFAK